LETLTADDVRVSVETGAALALTGTAGLGPAKIRRLIDSCGSASEALEQVCGSACRGRSLDLAAQAERELPSNARILSYGASWYPPHLRRLHDPPIVLWAVGPLPVASRRAVAIIGTRAATVAGRRLAFRISAELASRGLRVVSGLAKGIDAEAHRGALEAGGETLAVLGSGLNFEYPSVNRGLYAELRKTGALLTEFAPPVRPVAHRFPQRNRIVAGLADAVLVVQAGLKSGARITASYAADIGVDVLACPGPVDQPASEGCHALLKDGAGMVTCVDDVLQALAWDVARPNPNTRSDESTGQETGPDRAILDRLAAGPAVLDELSDLVGGPGPAAASLGRLEARGQVAAMAGTQFEAVR